MTAVTTFVSKNSPLATTAVRAFNTEYGFNIVEVLSDDHWGVALLDGRPEVIVSAAGVRALGLLSPRPDGQQIAEAVINRRLGAPPPIRWLDDQDRDSV